MVKHVYQDGKRVATIKTAEEEASEALGFLVIGAVAATIALPWYVANTIWDALSSNGVHSLFGFIAFLATFFIIFKVAIANHSTRLVYISLASLFDAYWSYFFFFRLAQRDSIWATVLAIGFGSLIFWGLLKFEKFKFPKNEYTDENS